MDNERLKTGTTTIAIKCKDGIVVAADKRMTVGNSIMRGEVSKVIPLNDDMAVTIAGHANACMQTARYAKAELKIQELRNGRKPTVKEAGQLLGQFALGGLQSGSIIHLILSGRQGEEFVIYDIFPDGSVTLIKDYLSSGSGSVYAMGLLEGSYNSTMSIEEGMQLAKRAINAALVNDSASGNGADIFKITQEGVQQVETITIHTGMPGM